MAGAIDTSGQMMLIAGAAMLYFASRAAVAAIAGRAAAPGRRALAHWLPIAAVTGVAIFLDQPALALAIVFATSVAGLALVGGCIAVMGNAPAEPEVWPQPARRAAGLLLPATVLAFLAGLSAKLGWFNAAFLAAEGIALWIVWIDPIDQPSAGDARRVRWPYFVLVVILLPVGAWAAVKGTLSVCQHMDLPSPAVIATMALSPLLVGPMLLSGSILSQRGQAWAAHSTHIAFAQLNLCALLPAAAIAWHLRHGRALNYPMANWRVEAVVLMLLAAAILPAAGARWRPGRVEGFVFIAVYVGYVLAVIAVSIGS